MYILHRQLPELHIIGMDSSDTNTIKGESVLAMSDGSIDKLAEQDQSHAKDKFTYLEEVTASKGWHNKRSLYQHLFNVYDFLKQQLLPDAVCDAGLFHSIYGTEFYDLTNDQITRDVVRGYIGEYAEELVHTFCELKKDRYLAIVNNTPGWDIWRHFDLCCIEYANFWDGRNVRDVREELRNLSQTIAHLMAEMQARRQAWENEARENATQ
jgi:hypothetical protein